MSDKKSKKGSSGKQRSTTNSSSSSSKNNNNKIQMFKIDNPETKATPWKGNTTSIQNKPGLNEFIVKNLGSIQNRSENIKKFMAQEDVKQILGEKFIKEFLEREPKMWLQQKAIGLDFANSGCSAALFDPASRESKLVADSSTAASGSLGSCVIPSCLYYDPVTGFILVGRAAQEASEAPDAIAQNFIHSVKRMIGKRINAGTDKGDKAKESDDQWARMAGAMVVRRAGKYKHSLRVVVLAAKQQDGATTMVEVELKPSLLVRKLLLYIICQYIKANMQAAEALVCTVPAIQQFTSYMKIKRILEQMGIFVPHMLAEPVAAFMHWFFCSWKDQKHSIFPAELPECLRTYFTLDLGHGTLDFGALVQMSRTEKVEEVAKKRNQGIKTLAVWSASGHNLLGGYEMDLKIRDHLLPKLTNSNIDIMSPRNQHLYLLLMRSIKHAKEMLSARGVTTVSVAGETDGTLVYWKYQLTKEEMDAVTQPVISDIVNAVRNGLTEFAEIAASNRKSLGVYYEAFLAAPKYLLISGGPARMASVVRGIDNLLAEEYPNITAQWDINPEVCVPLGGAVAASVLCCSHFHGTLLEKLDPQNLAVFSDNIYVSNMVVRKLVMPNGKVSKELFHGSMQNHTLVPKNTTLPFLSKPFDMESYCGADEIFFELYIGSNPVPWKNDLIVKERISLKGRQYVGVAVNIDANQDLSLKYYWPTGAKSDPFDMDSTEYRNLKKLTAEDLALLGEEMGFLIEDDVVTKEEIKAQNYQPMGPAIVDEGDLQPWQKLAAQLECRLEEGDVKQTLLDYMAKNNIMKMTRPEGEDLPVNLSPAPPPDQQELEDKRKEKGKKKEVENEKENEKKKKEEDLKKREEMKEKEIKRRKQEKMKHEEERIRKEEEIQEKEASDKKKKLEKEKQDQIKRKEEERKEKEEREKNKKKEKAKEEERLRKEEEEKAAAEKPKEKKKKPSPRKSVDAEIISAGENSKEKKKKPSPRKSADAEIISAGKKRAGTSLDDTPPRQKKK